MTAARSIHYKRIMHTVILFGAEHQCDIQFKLKFPEFLRPEHVHFLKWNIYILLKILGTYWSLPLKGNSWLTKLLLNLFLSFIYLKGFIYLCEILYAENADLWPFVNTSYVRQGSDKTRTDLRIQG